MNYFRILLISTLLFCHSAFSQGIYDGIWSNEDIGYASIHQKGDKLIFILLDSEADEEDGDYEWEAYWGDLVGNTSTVITLISGVIAELELVFESETRLKVKLQSCIPQTGDCDDETPVGSTFVAKRVW